MPGESLRNEMQISGNSMLDCIRVNLVFIKWKSFYDDIRAPVNILFENVLLFQYIAMVRLKIRNSI